MLSNSSIPNQAMYEFRMADNNKEAGTATRPNDSTKHLRYAFNSLDEITILTIFFHHILRLITTDAALRTNGPSHDTSSRSSSWSCLGS